MRSKITRNRMQNRIIKVNETFISHPTRAQHTLTAVGSVQASHAYCGAVGPVSKMASHQEKAFSVFRFEVSRSVTTVQREFRARFKKDAQHQNDVTRRYRQFVEPGCLCTGRSPGRPRVSDVNIERAREAVQRGPRKSVAGASRQLACQQWRCGGVALVAVFRP
jgi:hypothetical protein